METNKLFSFANAKGITVDRFNLKENSSVSAVLNDKLFIALDFDLSGKKEKVCLAHELGHCQTSGFYNIYSPLDIREKHEKRADRWAIKKLIPKYRFEKALREGFEYVYSLAEYFDVPFEFMEKAVRYYKKIS